MIGSSRETVTRLLSDMKRKDLIRLEGATLVIPNRIASQAIAPLEFPPPGGRSGLLVRPFFSSQLSVLSEKRWDQCLGLGIGKNDGQLLRTENRELRTLYRLNNSRRRRV